MHTRDKFSTFWWQADKKEVNRFIFDAVNHIDDKQQARKSSDLRHLRLYGNSPTESINASPYNRPPANPYLMQDRLTLNVVHSMVSTIVSKITKNRPRPLFLTSGGDWSMKRKAKLLNKFTQGLFYGTDAYKAGEDVCRDACIFGTGFMKIYNNGGEIVAERVFPHEILIDDAEAIYGKPRQMFQRKFINKEVLLNLYPEFSKEIIASSSEENQMASSPVSDAVFDAVEVVEAWHLPSTHDGDDGRHVIAIGNATLLDAAYTKSRFPFASIKWSERALGFWGQGISEQLTGLQIEINKLLKTIQIAMHLVSVPKIFVERGSKVSKAHINNEIGGIIEYAGTPPIYKTANSVSPEMFAHLDRLYQRAYEIVGISQLSASSKKPVGIDSGRALREFSDIESERFLSFARAYEQLFLDAAKTMVGLAEEVAETDENFSVTSFDKTSMQKIKWKDVNLKEDQYIMQVFPTSLLPITPAARLQTVEEMMRTGLLSREDGLALLDFPDLESVQNLEMAAIEEIEMVIEHIIDKGVYSAPEPFSNIPLCLRKMNQAYLRAKLDNVPEDRLELMRRYVADAQVLIVRAEDAQLSKQLMITEAQERAKQSAQAQSAPQLQGAASENIAPQLRT